jgi:osmotically-inducible protein OsmY
MIFHSFLHSNVAAFVFPTHTCFASLWERRILFETGREAMKLFKVLAGALAAIVVALTLSACAPTAKQEGTGGYIDDTVITTKVKAELLNDDQLKSREINVETFKGRVQLSGFVSSPQMASHAVEVTRTVKGVKSVVNNMQIK